MSEEDPVTTPHQPDAPMTPLGIESLRQAHPGLCFLFNHIEWLTDERERLAEQRDTYRDQRDHHARRAAFYKSCALSGEYPSDAVIAGTDAAP